MTDPHPPVPVCPKCGSQHFPAFPCPPDQRRSESEDEE